MRVNLKEKPLIPTEKEETPISSGDGAHDMVIAFDSTGSMSSYLSSVKDHVTSLVPELLSANPKMRIGIVVFGDYCDMESATKFGKAYQCLPLTTDQSKIINFVTNAERTNGGDGDEFYELVIKKITEETKWRDEAVKSVLLIADASPHKVGYSYSDRVVKNTIDWKEEAKKAAAKGIQFDTLSIHNTDWYKELSKMTNGVYAMFSSSNKTQEAVKMSAFSRGGETTRGFYVSNLASYAASKDTELVAMTNCYTKKLNESLSDELKVAEVDTTTFTEKAEGPKKSSLEEALSAMESERTPEPSIDDLFADLTEPEPEPEVLTFHLGKVKIDGDLTITLNIKK